MKAPVHWNEFLRLILNQFKVAALALVLVACATSDANRLTVISKWDRFERNFESVQTYSNPAQDVRLQVLFISPSGARRNLDGFWDGGQNWRVRFAPNEVGRWNWLTVCSDTGNQNLHGQKGSFVCTAPRGNSRFKQHGPVRVARDRRYLEHEDGTPFFWLADTAWSGPLLSTTEEWDFYLRTRVRQQFTAVQWVATQFRATPEGDLEKQMAYTGAERIAINPRFFQRLDARMDALNRAGLLSIPVLLWAHGSGPNRNFNPGFSLSEGQAILLARYMVARWGANDVVWILPGDGDYRGDRAEKWKRIGRAVFADADHAPVVLHPGGKHWNLAEFRNEPWLDIIGYQSGHGDDDATLRWLFEGPPATDWRQEPLRPFINLEPPYENHIAYQSQQRISPHLVRRAIYWSLLVSPTAGVTYGGHGVWGWDDGTKTPVDHPNTGIPLPWTQAVVMPGAEQMSHLARLFTSIDFWRLRPAPEMLAVQPGRESPARFIAAARTESRDLAVLYLPDQRAVDLKVSELPPGVAASWFNPRTGLTANVVAVVNNDTVQFATPGAGDWVLLLQAGK